MKVGTTLGSVVIRNLIGLSALVLVHYISGQYVLHQREGLNQIAPYGFLLLLYGWIVFHNRVLFEQLYRGGKKSAYWGWVLVAIGLFSANMHFILRHQFGVVHTLPHLASFWVYTVTGLGIYVLYQQQSRNFRTPTLPSQPANDASGLECQVDGIPQRIPLNSIEYLESLENYVKIITLSRTYVTRLTLKEAEARLPTPPFVRISRTHIVNRDYTKEVDSDTICIKGRELRIGKVYKRYVAEYLSNQIVNPTSSDLTP